MDDNFQIEDDENPFESRSYDVGYGKPPKEHRFKPGNKAAAGRRKRANERVRDLIHRRLNEKVTVTINGKRQKITKLDAIFHLVMQKAPKSTGDALRLITFAMQHEPEEPPVWTEQKIKVEFVHRDWSSEPLPGSKGVKGDDRPDWDKENS